MAPTGLHDGDRLTRKRRALTEDLDGRPVRSLRAVPVGGVVHLAQLCGAHETGIGSVTAPHDGAEVAVRRRLLAVEGQHQRPVTEVEVHGPHIPAAFLLAIERLRRRHDLPITRPP